jgi:hypothetical protein
MAPTKRVPIKIGDKSKTRYLRYDHACFVRLEEDTGKTIGMHAQLVSQGSAVSLTALLWAGLIHSEPDLTRAQVAQFMHLKDYKEYADAISQAQAIAMGDPDTPSGNDEA